jgi:hypothetical protein
MHFLSYIPICILFMYNYTWKMFDISTWSSIELAMFDVLLLLFLRIYVFCDMRLCDMTLCHWVSKECAFKMLVNTHANRHRIWEEMNFSCIMCVCMCIRIYILYVILKKYLPESKTKTLDQTSTKFPILMCHKLGTNHGVTASNALHRSSLQEEASKKPSWW